MPAAIIRGMSATACAKNSFREFRAGATTAELFPCIVEVLCLNLGHQVFPMLPYCTSMLIWVINSLYQVSLLISSETEISMSSRCLPNDSAVQVCAT